MGAQEFYHRASKRLNDQPVFFGAEFVFFHGLAENAAVQLVIHTLRTPPGHVLFCNVAALLYLVHKAGKSGRTADAALFQHANEGRLRVVRLQVAQVHAGEKFIVFDDGVGNNRLQQGPARHGFVAGGVGHNAPARKFGAFHGVPVFAPFGCRDARHQGLSRARRHARFGGVPPNHAIQALLFRGERVRHFNAVQRRDVHRFMCFLRFHIFHGGFLVHHPNGRSGLFLFHDDDAFLFFWCRLWRSRLWRSRLWRKVFIAPSFCNVGAGVLQERRRIRAAVGARIRDVAALVQVLARQHGVGG